MTKQPKPDNLTLMLVFESLPLPNDAPAQIKAVALRLFAERGVDGVTIRQIAEAAGQKNHGAVTYYFGSKGNLVRELIVDGARAIDARRNAWLDSAEEAGGPHSVTEVMEGLVRTSVDETPPSGGECYNRFILLVSLANRALFMEALAGKWNRGYLRCQDHIRRLRPDIAPAEMNRRLLLMGTALSGIIASREAGLADQSRSHSTWGNPHMLTEAAKALAAILEQG